MPIRNPQALRQAYETLHLRSSGSVETNNEELEQQKTNIKLEKNVLGNKDFKEENDTSFNELDLRDYSVRDFFILYKQLFYEIPSNGYFSHEKIIQRSREYIGGYIHPKSEDINNIYTQLKTAYEQLKSIENIHSVIPNNSLIVRKNSPEYTQKHYYYIQSFKKRRILGNEDLIGKIKVNLGHSEISNIEIALDYSAIEEIPNGPVIQNVDDLNMSLLRVNVGVNEYNLDTLINLFGSINISPDEYYNGSVPPRDNIGIETEDESNRQNSGTNSYV